MIYAYTLQMIILLALALWGGLKGKKNLTQRRSDFIAWCTKLLITRSLSRGTTPPPPVYKFYSLIAHQLLINRREWGMDIDAPLRELRQALWKEDQQERRLSEVFKHLCWQYGLAALLIWIFMIMTAHTLSLNLSSLYYAALLLWQALGVALTIYLFHTYRRRSLGPFGQLLAKLYPLKALLSLGRPLNRIEQELSLGELDGVAQGQGDLVERVYELLEITRLEGKGVGEDLQALIDEVWFRYQWGIDRFLKHMGHLKLLTLPLFFFGSYCFHLVVILRMMMQQSF